MRLVDADELIKDRVENDPVRIAVETAPTAFDLDKVTNELDEYRKECHNRMRQCDFIGETAYASAWRNKEASVKKVIRIVKSAIK